MDWTQNTTSRRTLLHLGTASLGLAGLASLGMGGSAKAATTHTSGSCGCQDPVWSSSDPGLHVGAPGSYSPPHSPYVWQNDMWNAAGFDITQTIYVCESNSWWVDTTMPADIEVSVKTYPNIGVEYLDEATGEEPLLSEFPTLVSSYSGQGAGVGRYDVAYDIWLNGFAIEVMIWTDRKDVDISYLPQIGSNVMISGRTWDVWMSGSSYLAFVPPEGTTYPSGTLDLKEFLDYLVSQGRIPTTATLTFVEYGVEVLTTDGKTARFTCNRFTLAPTTAARGMKTRRQQQQARQRRQLPTNR